MAEDRPPKRYEARVCTHPDCGLRFPVDEDSPLGRTCPTCGAPTRVADAPYATHGVGSTTAPVEGLELEVLLDNIRSLRNVGSIFRTADGAGVKRLHLGGITPTPAHPKLSKTALGAEHSVPWTHHRDATVAAARLVAQGRRLWAVEGGQRSRSLYEPEVLAARTGDAPLCLVFGHEVSGIDPRIVDLCERVVHVPMLGIKDSLNVSVVFGVVLYTLAFARP